jgi:hypothetical protein
MLSMAILTFSCKKKKDPPTYCEEHPTECAPISEAKEFFLFKPGSWWVYQEETSLVRDSLYVTEYTNFDNYDFDARYKSALTGYEFHFFVYAYAGGGPIGVCDPVKPVKGSCITISRSKYKPNDFIAEDYCFIYNANKNDFIYTFSTNCETYGKITITEVFQVYSLKTFNYNKTIKINENCTAIENNQETNHYYSQGVGLIRKELIDSNQVWNLVNYHIEP